MVPGDRLGGGGPLPTRPDTCPKIRFPRPHDPPIFRTHQTHHFHHPRTRPTIPTKKSTKFRLHPVPTHHTIHPSVRHAANQRPRLTSEETTMTPQKCKTCKYWVRYSDPNDAACYGQHAGTCENKRFVYEGSSSNVKTPKDGVMYWDYEGCMAEFSTGEDFGCVHWKQRP